MTVAQLPQSEVATAADVSPPKYAFIDALRGWAILGVMATHCGGAGKCETTPVWLDRLCGAGVYGVQLFFVASALTLFLSLKSRYPADRRPILAFWVRRIFRIAPLFLLGIPFYAALGQLGPKSWAPDGIPYWAVALTAVFLHGWHPLSINTVVPGGWSIAVEMNFYVMTPFLFLWIRRLRVAVLFVIASAGFALVAKALAMRWIAPLTGTGDARLIGEFTYYWLPTQLPIFGFGILLFHILQSKSIVAVRMMPRSLMVSRGVLVGGVLLFGVGVWWKDSIRSVHLLFAMSFVLVGLGLALKSHSVLVNGVTRYIGKVSFGAYLAHFAILACVARWTGGIRETCENAFGGGYVFVVFVAVLTLTIPVAAVLYRLIEQPGQEAGRGVLQRLGWSRSSGHLSEGTGARS